MELSFRPEVAGALALAALVASLGPPLAAWLFRRRSGAPWGPLGWGALVFFVSQPLLRFPWAIPLNLWVVKHGELRQHPGREVAFLAFMALTAGLFEELGRYLGYRKLVKEHTWRVGVMYGLGHGGIESMLLVGLNLGLSLALYTGLALWHPASVPGLVPAEQMAVLQKQLAGLQPGVLLLSAVERVSSMSFHVAASVVVLQATRGRAWAWVGAAVLFHALTDFVGPGAARLYGPYVGEAVIGAFGLLSLGITLALRRREPADALAPAAAGTP